MKIVVLDGKAMNPGDLDWSPLRALGDCEIYERSTPAQAVERSAGAQAIVINKILVNAGLLSHLPGLKYVGVTATGYNVVDVAAARQHGVTVTNVPAYSTMSVAQTVFALLLELTQSVAHHSRTVREGRWSGGEDFCYWDGELVELEGLTMGIVGLGRIGRAVAGIASAMGMKVLAYAPRGAKDLAVPVELAATMEDVFARCDVVSLHCPQTAETAGMVGRAMLSRMKPSAMLINTARGGLINEQDLADALNSGLIAGAGLDVLAQEPPPADNPLLQARNCFITPHVAWATKAARQRLLDATVANLRAFIAGRPVNVVSG